MTLSTIVCTLKRIRILGLFGDTNDVNPLPLRTAKTGLTILVIFFLQKHFSKNISKRNVNQKLNNNSPSNIL